MLEQLPCAAEEARSAVSHDWIGNRIRRLSPSAVIAMRLGELDAREFTDRLTPEGLHAVGLRQLRDLTSRAVEGFSPRQLVSMAAFAEWMVADRASLGTALHTLYLRTPLHGEATIESIQSDLVDAADALATSLDAFRAGWMQPATCSEDVGRQWQSVLDAAEGVDEILVHLPRGIVIP